MGDHVVAGGYVRQGHVGVRAGGREAGRDARVGGGQGLREAAPAPGAAEVEAVQVRDLPVAWIRDDDGREQRPGLAGGQAGQERMQPPGELLGRLQAGHQLGLGQRRGQEVVPGRLPVAGITGIRRIPAPGRVVDRGLQFGRPRRPGPQPRVGQRAGQPERAVGVQPDPDRVGGPRQPVQEVAAQHRRQWFHRLGPAPRVRIVPAGELVGQGQGPTPAVRPLTAAVGGHEFRLGAQPRAVNWRRART